MRPLRLLPLAVLATACSTMPHPSRSTVTTRAFGIDRAGRPATLWTLRADRLEIDVTDHGATLVAVRAPDPAGTMADVVLGFDDVSGYESEANDYFGCTAGRICNRIAGGTFTLDGEVFELARNDGPNHLHGGARRSLDKVRWKGEVLARGSEPAVRFSYRSPDGEEGYPGNLEIAVTYRLDDEGLHIESRARTDRRTPINLTNHAYWNLAGEGAPTVLDHELWIDADHYTPVDDTLIPTGILERLPPALDFRTPHPIGLHIHELDYASTRGYDHNYVLRGSGMRHVATLRDPSSGRGFDLWTDQPGLQLYSGNFLDARRNRGKGGKPYARRSALCLETQHFPDSVHHPEFPNTILDPGREYRTRTVLRFHHR